MPPPIPDSLRAQVIEAVAAGMPARQAAVLYGVSVSSAIKWARRWRQSGSFAALPMHGHPRSPLRRHAEWLLELARTQPLLTLASAQIQLRERGIEVALSSVWRFYHRHGIHLRRRAPRKPRAAVPGGTAAGGPAAVHGGPAGR